MTFFHLLKPIHKQPQAVYVAFLLIVFVVVLGVAQSRHRAHPPGSVTLAWDPSTSTCPDLGYTLYRREPSGTYPAQPVNKELIKEPKYTDSSVLVGKTYYYVVKSKCGNTESAPSNEMKVDVPYKQGKGKK
jgi:hypothetical protein